MLKYKCNYICTDVTNAKGYDTVSKVPANRKLYRSIEILIDTIFEQTLKSIILTKGLGVNTTIKDILNNINLSEEIYLTIEKAFINLDLEDILVTEDGAYYSIYYDFYIINDI